MIAAACLPGARLRPAGERQRRQTLRPVTSSAADQHSSTAHCPPGGACKPDLPAAPARAGTPPVLRVNNSQLRRNGGQIYAVSGQALRPATPHPARSAHQPRPGHSHDHAGGLARPQRSPSPPGGPTARRHGRRRRSVRRSERPRPPVGRGSPCRPSARTRDPVRRTPSRACRAGWPSGTRPRSGRTGCAARSQGPPAHAPPARCGAEEEGPRPGVARSSASGVVETRAMFALSRARSASRRPGRVHFDQPRTREGVR